MADIAVFPLRLSPPVLWPCGVHKEVIKTQLMKLESFNVPCPKALPLTLLNLRSTPIGKHRLSHFKIITGRPLGLDQGLYEPALRRHTDFLLSIYKTS